MSDTPKQNESTVDGEASIITELPVLHTAKRLKLEARKLDGMQRELYSLVGDSASPVAITPDSKFKNKASFLQKAANWKLAEFSPKPGLNLHHWVRATLVTENANTDRFSKFNVPVNVPQWDDADYKLFSSEEWSLKETRYLFELASQFDLQWFVIADRYDFENKNRSIEDLKERYYQVSIELIKNQPASLELGLSPSDEQLIQSMKFPKENELKRKQHLKQLLSRTPKEVAEEEALVLEARKLEAMSEKMLADRKDILRLLDSPQAISSKTRVDLNSSAGVGQLLQDLQSEKDKENKEKEKEKKSTSTEPEKAVNFFEGRDENSFVVRLVRNKLTPREIAACGISYGNTKHAGVYLRSTKITPIRQNLLPKVRNVANELGIPLKPVMPTSKICALYDELFQDVNVLLEAKKAQDRLELEIEVLKRAGKTPKTSTEMEVDTANATSEGSNTNQVNEESNKEETEIKEENSSSDNQKNNEIENENEKEKEAGDDNSAIEV